MKGVIVIDTNLLVLLIVGTASKSYIAKHKRLRDDYTADDFELLGLLISDFSEIVLLPHILAEVSSLARQIDEPARSEIQTAMHSLINTCYEIPIRSVYGATRLEFTRIGLTDAVLLHFCTMAINGIRQTLLTTDADLANTAYSLGYSVIDYRRDILAE